jgi:undecaprenyl-diphosphatase
MFLATLHSPISYFQAIVLGLLQGITELFPVSSLGHSVVLPELFGWTSLVKAQSASSSYFLTFLVGLHVATALGMLVFFLKDWIRIISALLVSIKERRIQSADARLGWLLVIATIPAGIMGLVFEKLFRTLFARPLAAAIFLVINGVILLVGEQARQRSESRKLSRSTSDSRDLLAKDEPASRVLETLDFKESVIIGVAQVFALLAGISRSGITMVAGLLRGLNHEDAARFSFLLATPIIFAAGVYKLPSLLSSSASAVRPEIFVGAIFAFIAAYFSIRFLTRYFETRNLYPFAAYCLAFGSLLVIRFA